jgi:hypothetical protein
MGSNISISSDLKAEQTSFDQGRHETKGMVYGHPAVMNRLMLIAQNRMKERNHVASMPAARVLG